VVFHVPILPHGALLSAFDELTRDLIALFSEVHANGASVHCGATADSHAYNSKF
jgi:hypothetical protein